jgi:hypothetical protein
MKVCSICKEVKEFTEFSRHKGKNDGYSSSCLICLRKKNKINREKNKINERIRVSKFLEINPNYRKNYMKEYNKMKREHSPIFKLVHNIRVRVRKFLKSKKISKNNKTLDIVGCNPEFLKEYLESKFTDGMSWDKMGVEIHIDHIIPLSSAKNDEEVIKLCHYTNLQPLWSKENLKKGDRIVN